MNTKLNVLITGTRAPGALDLARHFSRAGNKVFTAESLKYPLCRASRCIKKSYRVPAPRQQEKEYVDALLHIINECKIDLLVPTCEEIYAIARNKEVLESACGVFCAGIEVLKELHDKWLFIKKATSLAMAVPQTWLLESADDLKSLAQQKIPFDLILKPAYSRFASNIYTMEAARPEIPALPITQKSPWVAQQKLPGAACCTYSVVVDGKIQAHAVYPVGYRAGNGACIYFESVSEPEVDAWVAEFVRKIGFTGQIAFDFMKDSNGKWLPIECNPRATSGIHLFDGAVDFIEAFKGEMSSPVMPPEGIKKMLGLAMVAYNLPLNKGLQGIVQWCRSFFSGRDILFHYGDPMPFFYQFATFASIGAIARAKGISLMEATTYDIEWNGES